MKAGTNICEESVFSELYNSHSDHLRNFIYYKCGELEVAEDITQESYVRMWEKCRDVIFEKAKSFLFTIGYRLMLDRIKAKKVRLSFLKQSIPETNSEDPYFILRTEEFRNRIEEAISELPEGQREVFMMNRIDKLSYVKIAEILGISETAVEKRMSKALLKLREKIAEFKQYKI